MVNDVILSYHLNPLACGVARFNHQLAARLGVRCESVNERWRGQRPLLSLHAHELDHATADRLARLPAHSFDVLWHDAGDPRITANAARVWYAEQIGIPALVSGDPSRPGYRVLIFGMAHKLLLPQYDALKDTLDAEHGDAYCVCLSVALHEGFNSAQQLEHQVEAMRAIFGDKLRVLGMLGDDALAKELQDCDAVALFYHPAFRANNTTAWAARAAGKRVITNRDAQSPSLDRPPTWAHVVEVLSAP